MNIVHLGQDTAPQSAETCPFQLQWLQRISMVPALAPLNRIDHLPHLAGQLVGAVSSQNRHGPTSADEMDRPQMDQIALDDPDLFPACQTTEPVVIRPGNRNKPVLLARREPVSHPPSSVIEDPAGDPHEAMADTPISPSEPGLAR